MTKWIETHCYIEVSRVHTDIIQTYEDDFNKYKKRVSPVLLRQVLRSVANTQGSMQSLWIYMRKRQLHEAIRTSLENFGQFDHYDPKENFEQRHVDIVPLYALSNLEL